MLFQAAEREALENIPLNLILKTILYVQAAEREALEKAQERELRRQKEELMNGKVSPVDCLVGQIIMVIIYLVGRC